MPRANVHEKLLIFLLRFGGYVMLTAFGAMLMPVAWMEACHRWLGLGEFPASPLLDYLTRSIAALYGFHGGLRILVSYDLPRYARVIRYVAIMDAALGVMLFGIDWSAGMPLYWTLGEGPPLIGLGLFLLYLVRRVDTESSR